MVIKYGTSKYLNPEYITHVLPNRYNYSEIHIYMTNGEVIVVSEYTFKKILKKIKVEEIET